METNFKDFDNNIKLDENVKAWCNVVDAHDKAHNEASALLEAQSPEAKELASAYGIYRETLTKFLLTSVSECIIKNITERKG